MTVRRLLCALVLLVSLTTPAAALAQSTTTAVKCPHCRRVNVIRNTDLRLLKRFWPRKDAHHIAEAVCTFAHESGWDSKQITGRGKDACVGIGQLAYVHWKGVGLRRAQDKEWNIRTCARLYATSGWYPHWKATAHHD